MIGAREISEYAQKYNMKLGKDTPLSMEWCFNMADKAYEKGRADAIDEVKESINEHLFNSPMMNPIMTRNEILLFLEQLKESKE